MDNVIDIEFFEEMSPALKHVYFAYSLLGGVCYEEYITPKFKFLAICFATFSHMTASISVIASLFRTEGNFQVTENFLAMITMYQFWIMMAVMAYLKRDTYRALFEYMNENMNKPLPHGSNYFRDEIIQERSVENFNSKAGKYVLMWLAMLYLCTYQKFLNTEEEFHIDHQHDFLTPFPFIVSQSVVNFLFIHHLTFTFIVFYAGIMYGAYIIPILFSIHLENQMIRLQNDMNYHTSLAYECLEECSRREEELWAESIDRDENVRRMLQQNIETQRERHIKEFMLRVEQWIRMHQRWILGASLLRECSTSILTTHVTLFFIAIIASGYILTKMVLDSQNIGFEYVFYIFLDMVILIATCAVGNSLDKMSDIISTAIYSTPWYYLPKKHQKTLLNFLCLTQNSPKIHILKIFPLSLKLFPEVLNKAYDYIQILRVLEMKK